MSEKGRYSYMVAYCFYLNKNTASIYTRCSAQKCTLFEKIGKHCFRAQQIGGIHYSTYDWGYQDTDNWKILQNRKTFFQCELSYKTFVFISLFKG
jgi:hypothetical protein